MKPKPAHDPEQKPEPQRILVLRYSSLGDVALTVPVLDGLLAAFPRARVFYATKEKYAPVVREHPALAGVVTLKGSGFFSTWAHFRELKALKPTLVLDLHDSLRTHLLASFLGKTRWQVYQSEGARRRALVKHPQGPPSLHTIQKYLKVLEPLGVRPHLKIRFELPVSKKQNADLKEFMERRKIHPSQFVVGLGPGSLWKTKQWMPENYAELASRLVEDYRCTLWWFGSKEEAPLIQAIQAKMRGTPLERGLNLAESADLERSITLLGRCDLFIGNDSGLTHLASGRGCRVVVLYGSTTPSLGFEPWGPHSVVEVAGLPCRPCDVHGKNVCPLGHFKCMKDMTVDLVEGAVKRSMRRSR
ncbi:MAG TPA: glycosyltransferase family 9 protein [bacterium]|nr:glycosyltransferase family 9 protein [bacterium]